MRARYILLLLVVLLLGLNRLHAADTKNTPEYLASFSVTIDTPLSVGSGIAFTRKDTKGNDVTFIWTAGHIVHHAQETDPILVIIVPEMTNNMTYTNFTDLTLSQDVSINGKFAYKTNIHATPIKLSPNENGDDLAVLRVNGKFFNANSVTFDLSDRIPKLGEPLYGISSPYGEDRCYSDGAFSGIGRVLEDVTFDQTSLIVFPGSSGGGAFATNGLCMGLNDVQRTANISYIVPVRRMHEWAKREGIEWAINPLVPMPSDEALKALPLLDQHPRPVKTK